MKRIFAAIVSLAVLFGANQATAQKVTPDVVLVNGKVVTTDAHFSIVQALAVKGGRITAVGPSEEMRGLAGPGTREIDLGGRTVIPGLIDSHIHAIRAGLTFNVELNWIGVPSLAEAMDMIHEAAHSAPPGNWITVAGGWQKLQFKEKRGPTPAELTKAAPDHPVYVQHLYEWAALNELAMKKLNITAKTKLRPRGKVEIGADSKPTGMIYGIVPTFARLFNRIPKPDPAGQVKGSRAYFHELNRVGLTGINDVAGGGMFPRHYQALFKLWRDHALTVRVAFHLMSPHRGKELADLKAFTRLLPMGFGDDMLKFNGIGEVVIWGMHDGSRHGGSFKPKPAAKKALLEAARWAARKGLTLHMHATADKTAAAILNIFEQVNTETPITGLRWIIPHIEDMSEDTMRRMKALGMGYGVQDRLYFQGDNFLKKMGKKAARRAPPIKEALRHGLVVGAGTDSHRVSPYNPFVSLRWLLDGKSISGKKLRAKEESPNREEALRMYTTNGAWMAFDDKKRGSLEPGKFADLVVLSKDYLTVPVEDIGSITSLLTMVSGRIVYAADPYSALQQ